jgi:SAM-dependent methyltransferase
MTDFKKNMISQFGNPRGVVGRVAGWVLGHRGSNRQRNRWAVSLLDVRPTDRVLEIGFGAGIAIAELASRGATVYGVDHSEVMVRQASRRNPGANVHLMHASVDRLPSFGEPLDVILTVNSLGFWPEPAARLEELRQLLRPGGRIAVVSQPRVSRDAVQAAREIQDLLHQAGFGGMRVETLDLDPPVACVIATAP